MIIGPYGYSRVRRWRFWNLAIMGTAQKFYVGFDHDGYILGSDEFSRNENLSIIFAAIIC